MENRLTDKGGEQEGEGEMNGESSADACTPPLVTRQPVGNFCLAQGTKLWLSDSLERWEWAGRGREIQERGATGTPMFDSC